MSPLTFVKKKSFIDLKTINIINQRFEQIFRNDEYNYGRKEIREIQDGHIANEPLFKNLSIIIEKELMNLSKLKKLNFVQLRLEHNQNTNNPLNVHNYHFDKIRFWKAMVFLTEITNKDGPICFAGIHNNIDIEERRLNLPKNYQKKKKNLIEVNDLNGEIFEITGNPGDVVFFDTNTPHKASIPEEGHFRKILRFDYEKPNLFSQFYKFKRIVNRYKNIKSN